MAIVTAVLLAFLMQGDVQLGQQVSLRSPDEGHRLAVRPPAGDFRIEVQVTCERPGTILDTVGINAAPAGSYTLFVGADRKVTFQVWQPGWILMTSSKSLGTGPETVVVSRRGETVSLFVGGETMQGTIKAPLSRDPLWVGDFHGDESWGEKYSIHRGMVGSVRVMGVEPMAVSKDLVVDETGTVSAEIKSRITQALEDVGKQTGGRLYVMFISAKSREEALVASNRLLEAQQSAFPNLPIGVLSYGPGGRAYSRSLTFDAKINFERVKETWDAGAGPSLAEQAAHQIEALAGRSAKQQAVVVGEASIGPDGGKISSLNADFELSIPSGALAETQKIKVVEVVSGGQGRVLQVEAGGGRLLAKPATLTYKIPNGVDAASVLALGQLTDEIWVVHPSTFNPATRMLTAQTNHFSNQGWFATMISGKGSWQAAGASLTAIGTLVIVYAGTTALLGAAISGSTPLVVAVAIMGHVGWGLGGEAYAKYTKMGYAGPVRIDGFDLFWKPQEVTSAGDVGALIDKRSGALLTWITDADKWQPVGQGATVEIKFPGRDGITLSDIAAIRVPKELMSLATDLSTTRRWYESHGLKPPASLPVLVTKDVGANAVGEGNAGEFVENTFLKISTQFLGEAKADDRRATIAHEYYHAVFYGNGHKEQFVGAEEAVATALESIVWPGLEHGMSGANSWVSAAPVLRNGLNSPGPGEGVASSDKRGYALWSFPKFVFHGHGEKDFRDVATGGMPGGLLEGMFRNYVRSMTNRDDGIEPEVDSDDGRGKVKSGWPVVLSDLMSGAKLHGVSPGRIDLPISRPLGVQALSVRLPASSPPAPLIVRRRLPTSFEELFVLKPVTGAKATTSNDRSRDEVLVYTDVVATPRAWDIGELVLPIVVSSVKGGEGAQNPLYVYRLTPPQTLESVAASDGFHLKWSLPTLNGVPPGDALWGYYIYGKLPGGDVRLVQELRMRPDQSPGGLSGKGGSRNAKEIPATATEFILPTVAGGMFEAVGIASVELVATEGNSRVASEIQWAAAASDNLLGELQRTTQAIVVVSGVTQVIANTNPEAAGSGYSTLLSIATWGGQQQDLLNLAKSYGKPITASYLTWSGPEFSFAMNLGPLEKTTTDRNGTTKSWSVRTLTVRGRYDSKSRSVVGVTGEFTIHDTSDFVPDPNWKPRSSGEALMGAPKASKSLNRSSTKISIDSAPFLRKYDDRTGNIQFAFGFSGPTPRPGCTATLDDEFSVTNKPASKKTLRVTPGPITLGVQSREPGVTVAFYIVPAEGTPSRTSN